MGWLIWLAYLLGTNWMFCLSPQIFFFSWRQVSLQKHCAPWCFLWPRGWVCLNLRFSDFLSQTLLFSLYQRQRCYCGLCMLYHLSLLRTFGKGGIFTRNFATPMLNALRNKGLEVGGSTNMWTIEDSGMVRVWNFWVEILLCEQGTLTIAICQGLYMGSF